MPARAPRCRRRTGATRRRRRGGSGCRSASAGPRPTSRRSAAGGSASVHAGVRVEAVDRRPDREGADRRRPVALAAVRPRGRGQPTRARHGPRPRACRIRAARASPSSSGLAGATTDDALRAAASTRASASVSIGGPRVRCLPHGRAAAVPRSVAPVTAAQLGASWHAGLPGRARAAAHACCVSYVGFDGRAHTRRARRQPGRRRAT